MNKTRIMRCDKEFYDMFKIKSAMTDTPMIKIQKDVVKIMLENDNNLRELVDKKKK